MDPGEERLHGIIIPGRNGIEFVIVAPGAADAQAEKSLSDIVDDFIQRILTRETFRRFVLADLSGKQHGCSDEKSRRRILAKRIADQLLADEAVIRRVVVKGPDHIIAVRPGIGAFCIYFKAMRVGITHDIEPML